MIRNVRMGKKPKIDKNVILGYITGRKIKNYTLVIGDNPILRSGTIIYGGTKIGNNFETGHNVVIREENVIGDDCKMWTGVYILPGCCVGNRVTIHSNTCLGEYSVIEDDVFMGGNIVTTSVMHPHCKLTKVCMKSATIKKGAIIGSNTLIIPTVTIGENAFIGGGSVVTKDIPPNAVAFGNPAHVRGSIFDLTCPYGLIEKPYDEKNEPKYLVSKEQMRKTVEKWWERKDK